MAKENSHKLWVLRQLKHLLKNYSSILFDCDGVILNSNSIKTDAFRTVSLPFGEPASSLLEEFHLNNVGLSRYAKFQFFIEKIIPSCSSAKLTKNPQNLIDELIKKFSSQIYEGLLNCEIAAGLSELRNLTPHSRWYVVSGGDQEELHEIFFKRRLDHFFDGGIFGSPKDKHSIFLQLTGSHNFHYPALYFGDSRLDHEVTKNFGIDFVFVSQWTDFIDWKNYCEKNRIIFVDRISSIHNIL